MGYGTRGLHFNSDKAACCACREHGGIEVVEANKWYFRLNADGLREWRCGGKSIVKGDERGNAKQRNNQWYRLSHNGEVTEAGGWTNEILDKSVVRKKNVDVNEELAALTAADGKRLGPPDPRPAKKPKAVSSFIVTEAEHDGEDDGEDSDALEVYAACPLTPSLGHALNCSCCRRS